MADPEAPEIGRRAHRLAGARSLYLRGAAEQAIDWHPWGLEPFETARREHRPILLDVGAAWCHWCHVMDETTYSDPEVARLLGAHFVAIKVDRDERPEVDRRYQRQVGALTGEGGWPLTAFLTADGETFLGGTFFPPTDGHGRPGFRRLLREVARLWTEEPERISENAVGVRDALRRMREARVRSPRPVERFADEVVAAVRLGFDPVHGGFGDAPKFPHPTATSLLIADDLTGRGAGGAEVARLSLLAMANGGVYDQVGGGFHRYSVDAGWHVPHFEKMAADNAALLGAYVDGLRRFGDDRFREVIRGTADWVREVLGDADGGWGASQDADNAPGDDGGYFTWTRSELRSVLDPDEFRFAVRCFGVGTDARMPHDPDRNVLFRLLSPADAADGLSLARRPEDVLAAVVERLKRARDGRPRPAVDPALYADLNGRFVGAFARAAVALGDPDLLRDARRAADRWLAHAYSPDRGIAHRLLPDGASGFGLLEDQASFAAGLVELAAATAEPEYARRAAELLDLIDANFREDSGLLRDVAPSLYDGPAIGPPAEASFPLEDSPNLSANSAVALAGLRLAGLVHDARWSERSAALIAALSAPLSGSGLFGAGAAWAARVATVTPVTVVVEGEGPGAERLLRAARGSAHPNLFVFWGQPPPPFSAPLGGYAAARPAAPRALVCTGPACAPPIEDADRLSEALRPGPPPVPP